jgi:hypothetical protein
VGPLVMDVLSKIFLFLGAFVDFHGGTLIMQAVVQLWHCWKSAVSSQQAYQPTIFVST